MYASNRSSHLAKGSALLLVVAVAAVWLACGESVQPRTVGQAQRPPADASQPVDPMPIGISALERYLEAPGRTPLQRYRAMSRLAALLTFADDADGGPAAARALYRRMLAQFPSPSQQTRTLVALADVARAAEETEATQQALRAAVCSAAYPYPTQVDPQTGRVPIARVPQDHRESYWLEWSALHPRPLDRASNRPAKPSVEAPFQADKPARPEEETAYRPPYDGCEKPDASRSDLSYRHLVAMVWLDIAGYHQAEDTAGGPYALHRALDAYRLAAEWSRDDDHSIRHAMARLSAANTLYDLHRYQDATREAVALLTLLERRTGPDAVTVETMRARAVHLIALSLTHADFVGPPPADPQSPRNDTLDVEEDPRAIEKTLRVALDRARDPKIVPQDRPWTPAVYQALAIEYEALELWDSYLATHQAFLAAFPLHRSAPVAQHRIALAYERLASWSPRSTTYRQDAHQARSVLAATYGERSRWWLANAGDAAALERARQLIRQAAGAGP